MQDAKKVIEVPSPAYPRVAKLSPSLLNSVSSVQFCYAATGAISQRETRTEDAAATPPGLPANRNNSENSQSHWQYFRYTVFANS
eukprot:jgi/Psemu1/309267/fgenesh1_kg.494_\